MIIQPFPTICTTQWLCSNRSFRGAIRLNFVQADNYLKPLMVNWVEEKTGKRKGMKKHLRGLVDASARNDDTAYGCMQFRFLLQPYFRFSQIMLFFTTPAHFTWLLHVHLHIITSNLLEKF